MKKAVSGAAARDAGHQVGRRQHYARLRDAACMFLVPDELHYLYTRARHKGEGSITWGRYVMGSAFNLRPVVRMHRGQTEAIARARGSEEGRRRVLQHAEQCLRAGDLLVPAISACYAGPLDEVRAMPAYQSLARTARSHGVELMLAPMSLTVALNVGARAFGLSYLAESPPPFE
ncbi:DegV family protein [Cupriavidus sp. MP-37]|nr:DegV family protein [Cupriavidus sp. MP-37]UDM50010.1 DegV family protein [Cupriavidus sp. MP-37]